MRLAITSLILLVLVGCSRSREAAAPATAEPPESTEWVRLPKADAPDPNSYERTLSWLLGEYERIEAGVIEGNSLDRKRADGEVDAAVGRLKGMRVRWPGKSSGVDEKGRVGFRFLASASGARGTTKKLHEATGTYLASLLVTADQEDWPLLRPANHLGGSSVAYPLDDPARAAKLAPDTPVFFAATIAEAKWGVDNTSDPVGRNQPGRHYARFAVAVLVGGGTLTLR